MSLPATDHDPAVMGRASVVLDETRLDGASGAAVIDAETLADMDDEGDTVGFPQLASTPSVRKRHPSVFVSAVVDVGTKVQPCFPSLHAALFDVVVVMLPASVGLGSSKPDNRLPSGP